MSSEKAAKISSKQRSAKRKRNQMAVKNSFQTYTHRVLKQMRPNMGISRNAMHTVETLLQGVLDQILTESGRILRANKKATLSEREVQTAVRLSFPGEIAKQAVSEATKAVVRYNSTEASKINNTRTKRAGLVFPVGRTERLMRERRVAARIGGTAAVYLAAVLEYVAREIVELSNNAAKDEHRKRIAPRHIMLVVKNDEELNKLFPGAFARSGVTPRIHEALVPKKRIKV